MATPAEIMKRRQDAYRRSVQFHRSGQQRQQQAAQVAQHERNKQLAEQIAQAEAYTPAPQSATAMPGMRRAGGVQTAAHPLEFLSTVVHRWADAKDSRKAKTARDAVLQQAAQGQLDEASLQTMMGSEDATIRDLGKTLYTEMRANQRAATQREQDLADTASQREYESREAYKQRTHDARMQTLDDESEINRLIKLRELDEANWRDRQRWEKEQEDAEQAELDQAATEELQDSHSQFVDMLSSPDFPGAVGMIDQYTGAIGSQFGTAEGVLGQRAERLATQMVLDAADKMGSQISDKDIELMIRSAPKRGDSPSVWYDWYNREFRPKINRGLKALDQPTYPPLEFGDGATAQESPAAGGRKQRRDRIQELRARRAELAEG